MTKSDRPAAQAASLLHEHPEPELTQYRPVSVLALIALGTGLLSITALAYPLLWVVPLVGAIIGGVALWRIDHAEQPMLGRRLAVIGLALSVTLGVAAPTQRVAHDYWIGPEALRLAGQFLELIQTDPAGAYRLMFRAQQKSPPPERATGGQPPEKPKPDLEVFLSENPVAKLIRIGPSLRAELTAKEIMPQEGGRQQVILIYDVTDVGDPNARPLHVALYLQRSLDSAGQEHWHIMTVSKLQTSPIDAQ